MFGGILIITTIYILMNIALRSALTPADGKRDAGGRIAVNVTGRRASPAGAGTRTPVSHANVPAPSRFVDAGQLRADRGYAIHGGARLGQPDPAYIDPAPAYPAPCSAAIIRMTDNLHPLLSGIWP